MNCSIRGCCNEVMDNPLIINCPGDKEARVMMCEGHTKWFIQRYKEEGIIIEDTGT